MRWLTYRLTVGVLACGVSTPALVGGSPDSALTLRLRDVSFREVAWTLFRLTGQGYVVGGDVVGKVNVELHDVTAGEVERLLSPFGLFFTGSGNIRRVSTADVPDLPVPGSGHPITLAFVEPTDTRDFLRLMMDVTGNEILAPAGPLRRFSLFATEMPADDHLAAALSSAGLESRRDGDRILVRRRGQPQTPLLPLDTGGLTGHVAYRAGEESQRAWKRRPGMEGYKATELSLSGLAASDGSWAALLRVPDGRVFMARTGHRLFDSLIELIDERGAIIRKEDGETITLGLLAGDDGITPAAEDLGLSLERAEARLSAGDFENGERVLVAALEGQLTPEERSRVRAALADLHYQWSQSLSAQGDLERAVRHLEASLEIDRSDRPWQAAEDLNEIGKAWTALGEPERGVSPHREALEIARSGAVRKAPRPFSCVRTHERTPWIEADALDGLANAERVRGRLSDAAELYERALSIWEETQDPIGRSTALTGLGLVRQGLGQFGRAAKLHREALALVAQHSGSHRSRGSGHPVVRAIILNNLGTAQLAMRQLDAAFASFSEALGLYLMCEHRSGEGTVLNNLGAYWEAPSDLAKACESYAEALVASRQADDRRGEAITRGHIERLSTRGSHTDESRRRCQTAIVE